jgi:hypothetical protein
MLIGSSEPIRSLCAPRSTGSESRVLGPLSDELAPTSCTVNVVHQLEHDWIWHRFDLIACARRPCSGESVYIDDHVRE